MMPKCKPLVLLILDGWGYSPSEAYNAISLANTPQWDDWWKSYPHCFLEASSQSVGLPGAQMGNSEVGHMHIGAGRIIPQDLTRINQSITTHHFEKNPTLLNLIQAVKNSKKFLHVMGLFSDGGVHSHEDHLFAFLRLCHQQHLKKVCLHLFLDGRDTSPRSALESLARLNQHLEKYPGPKICSISGRYFAMDRDKRWERIAPVYRLLTEGKQDFKFETTEEAVRYFYAQGKSDEFIPPTQIGEGKTIEAGDSIFFFNFRADRARQLTEAFLYSQQSSFRQGTIERVEGVYTQYMTDDERNCDADENSSAKSILKSFQGFPRHPALAHFVTMTHYGEHLLTEIAFPPLEITNTLGEVLAKQGFHQLRIAETEKYAHVTFFLNGGVEQLFPNEHRLLIPSPQVPTYDLLPQMSAPQLTDALVDAIRSQAYQIIICNYANADMVGHTGNLKAAIEAIECLDHCFQRVGQALAEVEGLLLVTADHGNAECMFDESIGQPHTAHTCEPVPFLFVGKGWDCIKVGANNTGGSLIDIAPTILALLGIAQPKEMTGKSLLKKHS